MKFDELCSLIKDLSEKTTFQEAGNQLEKVIFNCSKKDFMPLITEIGTIPEFIGHDSKEEKLYSKASDITLAKCFHELGLKAIVLQERSNSADIEAKSIYHDYSLVGDAKSFRLSRTAKNQKDFKVESMDHWRGDNDYSVLVCPYFQYPKTVSQIYGQALNNNVSLFSWEYFSILLQNGIQESEKFNLSILWNQSALISVDTSIARKNNCFFTQQNKNICDFMNISDYSFETHLSSFKQSMIERGEAEIDFWQREIERIKTYSREKAIDELIVSLKLNEKIAAITKFTDSLR
nr:HindIII family type II restriction endonuclease [uncultured Treponema sp.]